MSDFIFLDESRDYRKELTKAQSLLIIGFQHMIKWKEQPCRQDASWAESIRNSITELEIIYNRNQGNFKNKVESDAFSIEAYESAKKLAKADILSGDDPDKNKIVKAIDNLQQDFNYFTFIKFINRINIDNFMHRYATNKGVQYIKILEQKVAEEFSMHDLLEKRRGL